MRWTEADLLRYQQGMGPKAAKRPKFGNIRDAEGDSKTERDRGTELELLERAGEIRNLRRQVNYALVVNGILVCSYRADFVYEEGARTVVEDRKSPPTRKLQTYQIKRKLMLACHGIEIRET